MAAADFVAALDTVEQDHELLMDRMQALKDMMTALATPESSDLSQLFARLQELNNYFVTQFTTHMDEEETSLFPLLEQFPPDGSALAAQLREEHTALRRRVEDFNRCLAVALELQERPPRAVLRDLLTYTWELWGLLDKHAHSESQGLHACLDRYLRHDKNARLMAFGDPAE
jgi:hemerythrin-like domain-containing protein